MEPNAYRLPDIVRPERYDLALAARLDAEAFTGRVTIQCRIVRPTDTIELHARDLTLAQVALTAGGRTLPGTVDLVPEAEMARIHLPETVEPGTATLEIAYTGRVNPGLEGLYRATDGPESLLCTQCEATAARQILPCWDEPAFKARFAFAITTTADLTVRANGPGTGVTDNPDGTRTWTFAATPPMSSYLIGFVLGAIASTPETTVNGTPLRVWAMAGKEALGAFAHAYTARLLPWYEDYFGVPYHFGKYDQVAVPGFAAGAMENSGLVLFRQPLLLMDPRTTAWQEEKRIASVVAHEFAHQWFGNLVTMAWWDDIWLNEAFADWMAYRVVDALDPGYEIWTEFQQDVGATMLPDALQSTHPIYKPVATAAEAEELFDNITYTKGCAVLRMLESYLGPAPFQAGIQAYMRHFGERNATGADLWAHLAAPSDAPVAEIMQAWITQSGFPVLAVAQTGRGADAGLRVRQQRFFAQPGESEPGTRWPVPVVVRYADGGGQHEVRALVREAEATIPLPLQGDLIWCYANAGQAGYYRLDPDPALLAGLRGHLDALKPVEQVGLIDDQWALVQQGSHAIAPLLDLLAALSRSADYNVLQKVTGVLHTLDTLLQFRGARKALAGYRAWVGDLFAPQIARLGWEPRAGEAAPQAEARATVVAALARLARTPDALAAARRWAAAEAADPAAVDPNLAPIYISAAAQSGDDSLFDRYLNVYSARKAAGAPPQETDRYLYAFAAFEDPALVARTFDLLDTQALPQESVNPLLRLMLSTPPTQQAAWDYLRAHWDTLIAVSALMAPTLVAATSALPPAWRPALVDFFAVHAQDHAKQSAARALATLDARAALLEHIGPDLEARFGRA